MQIIKTKRFNPNHDPSDGRFTFGEGGGSGGGEGSGESKGPVSDYGLYSLGEHTEGEKQAIEHYIYHGYKDINNWNRTGAEPKDISLDEVKKHSANLDSAVRKGELAEDKVVYRGTSTKAFEGANVGDIVSDAGFLSTTPKRKVAQEFSGGGALLAINVKKGTKALDTEKYAGEYGEKEIIFPRNTKMKITNVAVSRGVKIYSIDMIE